MDDDRAARELAGPIAFGADAQSFVRMEVADPRVTGQIAAKVGPIIDDDELAVIITLALEVNYRLQHPVAPVARWHDTADERLDRARGGRCPDARSGTVLSRWFAMR